MTEDFRWPKQDAPPSDARDPYNIGRWPGNENCKLLTAGKRPIPRPRPEKKP